VKYKEVRTNILFYESQEPRTKYQDIREGNLSSNILALGS